MPEEVNKTNITNPSTTSSDENKSNPSVNEDDKNKAAATSNTDGQTKENVDGNKSTNDNPDEDGKETNFDDKSDDGKSKVDEQEKGKKQSKEENAIQAQARREREEKERKALEEKSKLAKDNFQKGLFVAYKGINPYTKQALETDYDYEVLQDMIEMEKQGLDPESTSDLIKFQKEKKVLEIQKKQKENEEKQAIDKRVQEELDEFTKKYPNENLKNLFDTDEVFKQLVDIKDENVSITKVYELYKGIKATNDKLVKESVEEQKYRAMASPGSLKGVGHDADDTYTLDELHSLTASDLKKNKDKVDRSLKKYGIY